MTARTGDDRRAALTLLDNPWSAGPRPRPALPDDDPPEPVDMTSWFAEVLGEHR